MTRHMSPSAVHFQQGSTDEGQYGYDNPDRALCDFDPKLYLSNLVVSVSATAGSAKAAMMAWVLELPDGTDPARAATNLLDLPLFSGIGPDDGEASELIGLLRQVSQFPREKLTSMSRRRRRVLNA